MTPRPTLDAADTADLVLPLRQVPVTAQSVAQSPAVTYRGAIKFRHEATGRVSPPGAVSKEAAPVLLSHLVHFLYLDESGSTEPPDQGSNATPCMAIVGVIVDAALVPVLTREFLAFKRRHFPHRFERGHALSHVLAEVKGAELLQMTRHPSRGKRRRALLARSELLELLDRYGARVLGRVWVKQPGVSLKPTETYTVAVQDIAVHFGQFLLEHQSQGIFIADARNQATNIEVAHSVFTQKWRTGGDPRAKAKLVDLVSGFGPGSTA